MTAGQTVFSSAADAAALDVLAERLAVQEAGRGAAHAAQLRTLLQLHALYSASGLQIGAVPHAALALGCSEHRAGQLFEQALGLGALPGGFEALECGLLTVEQTATVVELLAPLPLPARLTVWTRLQQRLLVEADRGSVLPPARLSELLRRWVIAADPSDQTRRPGTTRSAAPEAPARPPTARGAAASSAATGRRSDPAPASGHRQRLPSREPCPAAATAE